MMNLKLRNILLILFITNMLNLNMSCQSKKKPTYNWETTVGAPAVYPAKVITGGFWAGDKYAGLPTGGFLMEGWGNDGLTMGSGDFVPEGLNVTWFSITENKFYRGEFKLPVDTIKDLFENGLIHDASKEQITYNELIVNMAPGGMVVVWMRAAGLQRQIEIGRYQASETEIDWKQIMPQGEQDRNKYVKDAIGRFPEIAKNLKVNGFQYGLYDSYRIKYPWTPLLTLPDSGVTEVIRVGFFNGEYDVIWGEGLKKNYFTQKAIPYEMLLKWSDPIGKYGADIYFDEKEVFEAFKEMYKTDKTLETQLVMIPDRTYENLDVYLRSKTEEIWLRKTKAGIYERTH